MPISFKSDLDLAGPVTGGFDLLRATWRAGEPCIFFDSVATDDERAPAGPEALRRWSFLARRPAAALCVRGTQHKGVHECWWKDGEGAWRRIEGKPWDLVRSLRAPALRTEDTDAPFAGGIAGFVSYDAGRLIEDLPGAAEDNAALPWLLFFRFEQVEGERSDAAASAPAPSSTAASSVRIGPVEARTSPEDFEAMVLRAKRHIHEGDIFQVNLSHRLECEVDGPALDLYARLREVNPAPFSAFFHSGPLPWDEEGFALLSSSPERLFSLRKGRLEARPIAGTRRRDPDPARDAALQDELRADPKEQAEHVMLVDLARNDLGRVATYGSVRVEDLLTVETYRTVHHLVSVVAADLAPGKDAVDALVAMFPGGTITGAPKVRSMEIIDALEPVRRGAYTGSLGWIDDNGDADLNILIRTILLRRGRAYLQVGAGIVEESEPRREYEETLAKAKGLLMALGKGSL